MASNRAALRHYAELGGPAGTSFGTLLSLAHAGDATAVSALERMSMNLGRGLRMIATALAPREIVIVGDFTSAWYRFGPMIEAEMRLHALTSGTILRPAYDGGSARLRSAVALVLNSGTLQ
jgi:predicted NBD/HSP70 family sugar kinase